jgi:hypothetical protein
MSTVLARESSNGALCKVCHYILIQRCSKCWHEQRSGNVYDKYGTNLALYGELAFEQSFNEQNRVGHV